MFVLHVRNINQAPVKFIANSNLALERDRVVIDDYLRVPGTKGRVFAIGDCAVNPNENLPPTATVAEQQALYLTECFNKYYSKFDVLNEKNDDDVPLPGDVLPALMPFAGLRFLDKILCHASPKFQYKNRGAMASMGFGGGVTDLKSTDLPSPKTTLSGYASFLLWRSTYLTKQLSLQNMILIPMYWFKAIIFGRDISRFQYGERNDLVFTK